MLLKLTKILTLLLFLSGSAYGQATSTPTDLNKILASAEVVGKDTFASFLLDEFEKTDKLPKHLAKKQENTTALSIISTRYIRMRP